MLELAFCLFCGFMYRRFVGRGFLGRFLKLYDGVNDRGLCWFFVFFCLYFLLCFMVFWDLCWLGVFGYRSLFFCGGFGLVGYVCFF